MSAKIKRENMEHRIMEKAEAAFSEIMSDVNAPDDLTFADFLEWSASKREIQNYRKKADELKNVIHAREDSMTGGNEMAVTFPLDHYFADGQYLRDLKAPAESFIVSKIHKYNHFFFLLSGSVTIMEQDGTELVKAPYWKMTKTGTRRFLYTHEPCHFVTVHDTNKTNYIDAEEDILTDSFDGFVDSKLDISGIEKFIKELESK